MAIAIFGNEQFEVPDGLTDDEIPAAVQQARFRGRAQGGTPGTMQGLAELLQGASGFMPQGGIPATTLPNIGGGDVVGLGLQGTQQLLQSAQQSNESTLAARMRQRETVAQQLEAEKDRAQQIKLEDTRMKNDLAIQKMQEAADKEEAKRQTRIEREQADRDFERDKEIEKLKQTGRVDLREMDIQARQKLAETPRTVRHTGGGRGGGSGMANIRQANGKPYFIDPVTLHATPISGIPEEDAKLDVTADRWFGMIDDAIQVLKGPMTQPADIPGLEPQAEAIVKKRLDGLGLTYPGKEQTQAQPQPEQGATQQQVSQPSKAEAQKIPLTDPPTTKQLNDGKYYTRIGEEQWRVSKTP